MQTWQQLCVSVTTRPATELLPTKSVEVVITIKRVNSMTTFMFQLRILPREEIALAGVKEREIEIEVNVEAPSKRQSWLLCIAKKDGTVVNRINSTCRSSFPY